MTLLYKLLVSSTVRRVVFNSQHTSKNINPQKSDLSLNFESMVYLG